MTTDCKTFGNNIETGLNSQILASFSSASQYTLFSGATSSGNAGGWYGVKHGSSGEGLFISTATGLVAFNIDPNNNITYKKILK